MNTTPIVCPNCAYRQEEGERCRKCSTVFAYYERFALHPAAASPQDAPAGRKSGVSVARRLYRISTWVTLGMLVVAILLVLRKSPPPEVPVDPQAAARVEEKLRTDERLRAEEKQQASETPAVPSRPHELRFDAPELNSLLSSSLALKPETGTSAPPSAAARGPEPSVEQIQSTVKDVKVNLLDDRVQAYVVFDFHGQDLSLLLEGRLGVEDGYLRFEPTSGKIGSLPIPHSTLEEAVRRLLASPENKEKLHVPDDISNIRVRNGELVVTYR